MRYKPWDEVRYAWTAGVSTTPAYTLSQYTFTGQYSYMDDLTTTEVTEGFGLMSYNARWYDPALGRFAQADTIIPQSQGVQAWDRYAYTNNNPVRYTDPSGHCIGPVALYCAELVVVGLATIALTATVIYINGTPQGQAYRDEAAMFLEYTSKRVLDRIEAFDKQVAEVNNGDIYPKIQCGIFCKSIIAGVLGLYFCVDMWEEQCSQALSNPPTTTSTVESTSTPMTDPNCPPPYAQCSNTSTSTPTSPNNPPVPTSTPTPPNTPRVPVNFPNNPRPIPI
ncbi:MAG: RHS repeat-associated core domain-containing protein [Chloroflexi bacterium]|nr:RHS repeat-associated core domain-containing protein [Chloroflexota bacterium]